MKRTREPLFKGDEIDDLSDFPVASDHPSALKSLEIFDSLASQTGFRSRDPQNKKELTSLDKFVSTGAGQISARSRNLQVNLRARQETIDLLANLARKHDWSRALTFERAVRALQILLDEGRNPKALDLGGISEDGAA